MNVPARVLPAVADHVKNRLNASLSDAAADFFDPDDAAALTEEQFGADVALLVDGVTKLQGLELSGDYAKKTPDQMEMQAQNLRKMFLAMAKDIRVILLKFRIHLTAKSLLDYPVDLKIRITPYG